MCWSVSPLTPPSAASTPANRRPSPLLSAATAAAAAAALTRGAPYATCRLQTTRVARLYVPPARAD